MADKALVSGCDERVEQVAEALRRLGSEVVVVDDPARVRSATEGLEPGSLATYVQLPISIEVDEPTVVGRVRAFLQRGLLARFDAAEAVLPALRPEATVVLVSGNTSTEGGALPDDAAARFALLDVLAHALRADKAPGRLKVRVVHGDAQADDVAAVALRGAEAPKPGTTSLRGRENDLSYEDWRVEVMGLATVQV